MGRSCKLLGVSSKAAKKLAAKRGLFSRAASFMPSLHLVIQPSFPASSLPLGLNISRHRGGKAKKIKKVRNN